MKIFLSVLFAIVIAVSACTKETILNNETSNTPIIDSVNTQYIVYNMGNSSYVIFRPVDTLDARYFKNLSETTIDGYSFSSGISFYFKFAGNDSVGIKQLTDLYIYQGGIKYFANSNIQISILQYPTSKNGYIIGSFSGTVKDTVASIVYPLQCSFKVQRDL